MEMLFIGIAYIVIAVMAALFCRFKSLPPVWIESAGLILIGIAHIFAQFSLWWLVGISILSGFLVLLFVFVSPNMKHKLDSNLDLTLSAKREEDEQKTLKNG